jgi:hypothetical protein
MHQKEVAQAKKEGCPGTSKDQSAHREQSVHKELKGYKDQGVPTVMVAHLARKEFKEQ